MNPPYFPKYKKSNAETTTFNYNANFLSRIKETKTKGERDEGANFNQIEEVR